jgi:hypothetical protein
MFQARTDRANVATGVILDGERRAALTLFAALEPAALRSVIWKSSACAGQCSARDALAVPRLEAAAALAKALASWGAAFRARG